MTWGDMQGFDKNDQGQGALLLHGVITRYSGKNGSDPFVHHGLHRPACADLHFLIQVTGLWVWAQHKQSRAWWEGEAVITSALWSIWLQYWPWCNLVILIRFSWIDPLWIHPTSRFHLRLQWLRHDCPLCFGCCQPLITSTIQMEVATQEVDSSSRWCYRPTYFIQILLIILQNRRGWCFINVQMHPCRSSSSQKLKLHYWCEWKYLTGHEPGAAAHTLLDRTGGSNSYTLPEYDFHLFNRKVGHYSRSLTCACVGFYLITARRIRSLELVIGLFGVDIHFLNV